MFKNRLKELRGEKGLTQRELADLINLSSSTIAMYETGQRMPDPEILQKLADVFGVTTDYLLGRTDIKSPADKITKALEDDPELLQFWEDISSREDLKIMFKQAKDLSPQDIKTIIALIRRFKNEQAATQL